MTPFSVARRARHAMAALVLTCLPMVALGADPLKVAASKGAVSLLVHVAAARGFFSAEGLDVELLECSSGRECFGLMVDGRAQVATAAEVVATLNSVKVPDLAIIATVSTSSHQIKLIGRTSAGATSAEGLVGKRIGTVIGTSAQYFLHTWLVFHGLDPGRVTVVGLRPDDVVPALQHGNIDAVAIWDPAAEAALRSLGADGAVLPNPRVYSQHFGLLTTRTTVLAQRTALLKMLGALVRAERFVAAEPQRASELLAARLGISPAEARTQMAEHDYRLRLDQALISTLSSQTRWAVRAKYLPSRNATDASTLVVTDLMQRVAPAAITVAR